MTGCPHCGDPVFRKSGSGAKLKARTKILVLHKSGDVETNCPSCGKGILLPLVPSKDPQLRKAVVPDRRFVVPRDR